MTLDELKELDFNPYDVLGLNPGCTDSDVKEAYSRTQGSEDAEKAFYTLKTGTDRSRYDLFICHSPASGQDLIESLSLKPEYKGPEFWYSYIKK